MSERNCGLSIVGVKQAIKTLLTVRVYHDDTIGGALIGVWQVDEVIVTIVAVIDSISAVSAVGGSMIGIGDEMIGREQVGLALVVEEARLVGLLGGLLAEGSEVITHGDDECLLVE